MTGSDQMFNPFDRKSKTKSWLCLCSFLFPFLKKEWRVRNRIDDGAIRYRRTPSLEWFRSVTTIDIEIPMSILEKLLLHLHTHFVDHYFKYYFFTSNLKKKMKEKREGPIVVCLICDPRPWPAFINRHSRSWRLKGGPKLSCVRDYEKRKNTKITTLLHIIRIE